MTRLQMGQNIANDTVHAGFLSFRATERARRRRGKQSEVRPEKILKILKRSRTIRHS
jgi:hypothetical protein